MEAALAGAVVRALHSALWPLEGEALDVAEHFEADSPIKTIDDGSKELVLAYDTEEELVRLATTANRTVWKHWHPLPVVQCEILVDKEAAKRIQWDTCSRESLFVDVIRCHKIAEHEFRPTRWYPLCCLDNNIFSIALRNDHLIPLQLRRVKSQGPIKGDFGFRRTWSDEHEAASSFPPPLIRSLERLQKELLKDANAERVRVYLHDYRSNTESLLFGEEVHHAWLSLVPPRCYNSATPFPLPFQAPVADQSKALEMAPAAQYEVVQHEPVYEPGAQTECETILFDTHRRSFLSIFFKKYSSSPHFGNSALVTCCLYPLPVSPFMPAEAWRHLCGVRAELARLLKEFLPLPPLAALAALFLV